MSKSILIPIVLGLLLHLCSNTQRNRETNHAAVSTGSQYPWTHPDPGTPLPLPDSLFAVSNLKSTIGLGPDFEKIRFAPMDSIQKLRLVATCPGLDTYPGLGTLWIMNDWQVAFVSKQASVEGHRPIIVAVSGTDFGALLLLVLDKENHPKSYRILSGGQCSDPFCDIVHSTLVDNKILSYRISCKSEPTGSYATADSISYLSTITATGQIETTQTDSVRYSRLFR